MQAFIILHSTTRSSRPKCSMECMFYQLYQNSQKNTCNEELYCKVATFQNTAKLTPPWARLPSQLFSCEFSEVFWSSLLQNIVWWLLLNDLTTFCYGFMVIRKSFFELQCDVTFSYFSYVHILHSYILAFYFNGRINLQQLIHLKVVLLKQPPEVFYEKRCS